MEIVNHLPPDLKLDVDFILQILESLNLPEGTSILDIGTGRGKMAILLALSGCVVITGEPEEHKWANWKKNAQHAGVLSKISFQPFRAENLPFEANSFQYIMSLGSFHHIKEKHQALEEFYRVLQPGGKALIFEFTDQRIADLKRILERHPDTVNPQDYIENLPFSVERQSSDMIFVDILQKQSTNVNNDA